MNTKCDVQQRPVAPDRLRALLSLAGLTERSAARELGIDESTIRDWCEGQREAPRMALYALEYLVALCNAETDAVSVACRAAAVQARADANKLPDPRPALALIAIAEVYERMERRHAPAEASTGVPAPKKDLQRPS
jgi:transcriptional regulator with XRE-family HTH domain